MQTRRAVSWISVVVVACFVLVALAAFRMEHYPTAAAAQSTVPLEGPKTPQETYEGIVTDSKCGAKHMASADKDAADCTRACVHGGQQFALVDGDKMFVLTADTAQMQLLKHFAGQRAKVQGTLNGNTISVSAVLPTS